MTKEEFFELATAYMTDKLSEDYALRSVLRGIQPYGKRHDEPVIDSFSCAAETGGRSGGNCWGGEARAYTSEVADPGIGSVLDAFLEEHLPNITFLQYRKLSAKVTTAEHTDSEYYGNATCYKIWLLSFDDAWHVIEDILS